MRRAAPLLLASLLAGCSTFRWTGRYRHKDSDPRAHHDASRPEPTEPLPALRADSAQSQADRARSYRRRAALHRDEASAHETLARDYALSSPVMERHCSELAARLRALADELERFAAVEAP